MRRTVAVAWAVCVLGACEPDEVVEQDVASTFDGGSEIDAPGIDAPGADVPMSGSDGGAMDAPSDAGSSDAGDFEGHIVRLANMHMTPVTVELCLYPDGIDAAPVRMMEALGRSGGLERLEVSARFAFTPSRGLVPVRVVDATSGDCETPIFSTAISGSRNRILFVLAELSFTSLDDATPAPTATDIWRHGLHDGASGVLAMTPEGGGTPFRPSYLYAPIDVGGDITYTSSDGDVLIDRGFTPLVGGALTSFTLAPTSAEVSFVLCDDRAAGIDGLTLCGDTVRP
jgi:hypothetical protein